MLIFIAGDVSSVAFAQIINEEQRQAQIEADARMAQIEADANFLEQNPGATIPGENPNSDAGSPRQSAALSYIEQRNDANFRRDNPGVPFPSTGNPEADQAREEAAQNFIAAEEARQQRQSGNALTEDDLGSRSNGDDCDLYSEIQGGTSISDLCKYNPAEDPNLTGLPGGPAEGSEFSNAGAIATGSGATSFGAPVGGGGTGKYEDIRTQVIPATVCTTGCMCLTCGPTIQSNHTKIRTEMQTDFTIHRDWLIDEIFVNHILKAMAMMTQQMTVVGMQQVKIIGMFFDAKHQMETHRLFQQLMAEAHKDYQPSEGMCDIGTNVRGLIASERKTNLVHQTLANRVMQRQLRTGTNLGIEDLSDLFSRIDMFKKTFCNTLDNSNSLNNICENASAPHATINKDVDYTRTVDAPLTLEADFTTDEIENPTDDEKSAFALMTNLFANEVLPSISARNLADSYGRPRDMAYRYMELRAIAAKRSVAQNSMSAIIAEKGQGNEASEYAGFLKSTIKELGVPDEEIDFVLGKNPSYFAQMEVLTKKLYQNPVFYTELYDKPTNVIRKRAAIRAIGLMQDRDLYKSLLRSEAVLSVLLESMLYKEHDLVYRDLNKTEPGGDPVNE